MELKDFIDSSNPLMEKFKDAAPGTYRHCQTVGALCETVGKELDLDVDSLVVAATLHDIGKCNNPDYFIENQVDNKNPHEDLDPQVSFQYISRHISDGVLRLIQLGLPMDVIKIVSEHHGDSLIRSIYNKAKAVYKGGTAEDYYRYKSCKPSTVEACVLMLSDVCESACRALHNSDKLGEIKEVVEKMIANITDDEQLDVLSIGQLRVVKVVLVKELENIFHKRLDYDLEKE